MSWSYGNCVWKAHGDMQIGECGVCGWGQIQWGGAREFGAHRNMQLGVGGKDGKETVHVINCHSVLLS